MKINLLNIKIHQFLAFGDAELSLNNRGYCLLTGINHDPRDNATSNGSGKSSLISAICWTLTGETVQEVKTNIANIELDSGCWVELTFDVDNHHYIITRYRDDPTYHNYLKIMLDGNDVSGKTLTDSEAELKKYLPDLTSDLISSVIILGQGLPHKFSNYKPSGRKELLEKLSKSDFMIEDIKERINKRSYDLNNELRTLEDTNLSAHTKLDIYRNQLENKKQHLTEISQPKSFDVEIQYLNEEIARNEKNLETITNDLNEAKDIYDNLNNIKLELVNNKHNKLAQLKESYLNENMIFEKQKSELQNNIQNLKTEINRLKSIKDVCPTCGQKIPNVIKPDTTDKESELQKLQDKATEINRTQTTLLENYNLNNNNITKECDESLNQSNTQIYEAGENQNKLINDKKTCEDTINNLKIELSKITVEKDNYFKEIQKCKDDIKQLEQNIEDTEKIISTTEISLKDLNDHIAIVRKLDSLAKRDFRGYLLSNIIAFIESKAKEYAGIVFGTNQLDFTLKGNNIEITYCRKAYESLSGGEKQKCDLCLQFALRDMMSQYLGFSSNILCLDEIFDGLDAISCDNVINMISTKLNDLDSIFIISHRSGALGIPVDSEIIIEKSAEGISTIR